MVEQRPKLKRTSSYGRRLAAAFIIANCNEVCGNDIDLCKRLQKVNHINAYDGPEEAYYLTKYLKRTMRYGEDKGYTRQVPRQEDEHRRHTIWELTNKGEEFVNTLHSARSLGNLDKAIRKTGKRPKSRTEQKVEERQIENKEIMEKVSSPYYGDSRYMILCRLIKKNKKQGFIAGEISDVEITNPGEGFFYVNFKGDNKSEIDTGKRISKILNKAIRDIIKNGQLKHHTKLKVMARAELVDIDSLLYDVCISYTG